jgi:hypothetical protein
MIIISQDEYNLKTQQFLNNVHFKTIRNNPTNTFQKEIKKVTNSCPILIPQSTKWKYTNMNPEAPKIRSLIKIHKLNNPIRPIVNWKHAPAYRLAKYISDRLQQELKLPYTFNVKNTQQLITELQNTTDYNPNLRLASFDITNMYTNIPRSKLSTIIDQICKFQNTPREIRKEITKTVNTILKQNYFNFENSIYKQVDGLTMGAPTSALFSEIYLQKVEHTKILSILNNNNICNYFRYVDDILIIYDISTTNITEILNQFNDITNKFTIHHRTRTK